MARLPRGVARTVQEMDHRASQPSRVSSKPAALTTEDVHGAIRMVANGLARAVQLSGVVFDGADEEASERRARLARVGFRVERTGQPTVAVLIGPRIPVGE